MIDSFIDTPNEMPIKIRDVEWIIFANIFLLTKNYAPHRNKVIWETIEI